MTFFIKAPADSEIVANALRYAIDSAEELTNVKMPMIKIPRSAHRKYNDGELASAALMLEKLHQRGGLCLFVDEREHSNKRALDRLIDALR